MYDEVFTSPNFGYPSRGTQGRQGQQIIGIGVHISGGEFPGNHAWIMNPNAKASYNVLVKRDGKAVHYVAPENTAWSHGAIRSSSWPLLKQGVNPNVYTLSVARVGSNQNLWTPEQMDTIVNIIRTWGRQFNFPTAWPHVFGHKHIDAVNRWYCPGNPFLKELYARLAIPEPSLTPIPPTNDLWHRVIAGSYRDEHTAQMIRGNLIRMGVTGAFIETITDEELKRRS